MTEDTNLDPQAEGSAMSELSKVKEGAAPVKRLRLAWIGDAGTTGGVPGLCRIFLKELANCEIELHWYARMRPEDVPDLAPLRHRANVRCFPSPYYWNWDSWYGRRPKLAFLVGMWRRIRAFRPLAEELVREHRAKPYDAVVQLSQGELLALRRYAGELPILLYPQVHAAGELRWCQLEEDLAKQCDPWWWRRFRELYFKYRARQQRRDFRLARGVLGVSRRFNELVAADYGIPPDRQGVVYHPLELPGPRADRREQEPTVRLLYVGRMSVRKGVEVMLAALPGLLASDPSLEVRLIGAGAQWSNYEPLLRDLPKERCVWQRGANHETVLRAMENADVLLMPSSYEPGGIVVTEALASGLVLAASREVGAAENLPPSVRWSYPPRDPAAFTAAVREAVKAVRQNGPALRIEARAVAEREFASPRMAARLIAEVERLVGYAR